MTIDEAIKILTLDRKMEFEGNSNDLEDALQLGIEALRKWKQMRPKLAHGKRLLLPGETE